MTLIDIAEIHPPRAGGRVANIIAKGGKKFEIWPEKLDGIVVGKSYMVQISTRDYQGRTIFKIVKISPAPDVPLRPAADPAPATTTTTQAFPAAGEAHYVGPVLAALITSGAVDKTQIASATGWLRRIWQER